jgi:hypothetical protein
LQAAGRGGAAVGVKVQSPNAKSARETLKAERLKAETNLGALRRTRAALHFQVSAFRFQVSVADPLAHSAGQQNGHRKQVSGFKFQLSGFLFSIRVIRG